MTRGPARAGGYVFGFDRLRRWLDLCRRTGITGVEVAHLFTQWGAKATPGIMVDGERAFGWNVPATDARYRELMEALPALQAVLGQEWDRDHVVFHISDEPSGDDGLASYLAAKAVIADLLEGWTGVDALSQHSFYTSGAVAVPLVAYDDGTDHGHRRRRPVAESGSGPRHGRPALHPLTPPPPTNSCDNRSK